MAQQAQAQAEGGGATGSPAQAPPPGGKPASGRQRAAPWLVPDNRPQTGDRVKECYERHQERAGPAEETALVLAIKTEGGRPWPTIRDLADWVAGAARDHGRKDEDLIQLLYEWPWRGQDPRRARP